METLEGNKYLNKLNEWIPIIGYEGCYEIFSDGVATSVRSLDRSVNGFNGKKVKKGKICKPFLRNNYLSVALSRKGVVKQFTLHRLLGIHYIPNPEQKATINHKDTDKLNNALLNLEWATMSEQIIHANKMGVLKSVPPTKKGDKLSAETKQKMSIARIGRKVSVSTRLKISNALRQKGLGKPVLNSSNTITQH